MYIALIVIVILAIILMICNRKIEKHINSLKDKK